MSLASRHRSPPPGTTTIGASADGLARAERGLPGTARTAHRESARRCSSSCWPSTDRSEPTRSSSASIGRDAARRRRKSIARFRSSRAWGSFTASPAAMAYIACSGPSEGHGTVFLVCDQCGTVAEPDAARARTNRFKTSPAPPDFELRTHFLEVTGRCPECSHASAAPERGAARRGTAGRAAGRGPRNRGPPRRALAAPRRRHRGPRDARSLPSSVRTARGRPPWCAPCSDSSGPMRERSAGMRT